MAPLRSTNKSNDTSTSEQATRHGTNTLQKQDEDDDMAESDNVSSSDVAHNDREESPEETQSKSAEQLLSTMVAGARKRHVAKKKKVFDSYNTATKTIETSIDTLFDEHEEKSSTAHEAQLKRLKELLEYKAKIEGAMEARLDALRASYDAHSRDVENVLSTRIKELK